MNDISFMVNSFGANIRRNKRKYTNKYLYQHQIQTIKEAIKEFSYLCIQADRYREVKKHVDQKKTGIINNKTDNNGHNGRTGKRI